MIVRILDIPPTERSYRFSIEPERMNGAFEGRTDIECTGEGLARLTLLRIESTINVSGKITVPATFACSRCTEEYDIDLTVPVRMVLSRSRDHRREDEEIGHGYFEGDEIDLAERCIETVALNLPERLFCDPQCKGLCYICGANLNETECGCKR